MLISKQSALSYLELAGLVILSLICYQGRLFIVFFLAPLQLLYYRYGSSVGRVASLFCFLILILWGYLGAGEAELRSARIISDILFAGSLLVMLDLSNAPRSWEARLLYLLSVAAITSLSFIAYLQNTAIIRESIITLVSEIPGVVDSSDLAQQFLETFFSVLMPVLLMVLIIGRVIAAITHAWMTRRRWSLQQNLLRFNVPPLLLWVFLLSWLVVLLSSFKIFPSSMLRWTSWNLALSLSVVYYIQGLHLIIILLKFYQCTERVRRRVLMLVVLLGFIPILGLIIGSLVILLGVGKLWISFPQQKSV